MATVYLPRTSSTRSHPDGREDKQTRPHEGIPLDLAAEMALSAMDEVLTRDMTLTRVSLIVHDHKTLDAYRRVLSQRYYHLQGRPSLDLGFIISNLLNNIAHEPWAREGFRRTESLSRHMIGTQMGSFAGAHWGGELNRWMSKAGVTDTSGMTIGDLLLLFAARYPELTMRHDESH